MKRKTGEDKNGKFIDSVHKWMGPELGYVEISQDDPEYQEFMKQQLSINIYRTKKVKK